MSGMDTQVRLFSFFPPIMLQRFLSDDAAARLETPHMEYFESVALFLDVSGFTKLSEALASQGPALGSEGLAKHLNSYMGQLIRIVSGSGADIFKFAGDAMIALWCDIDESDPMNNQAMCLRRAAQAGLEIQSNMNAAELAEGVTLSVKVGIGVGRAQLIYVGTVRQDPGEDVHVEYLVTGGPLSQSFGAEEHSDSGLVVMSPQAWAPVCADCLGKPRGDGFMQVDAVTAQIPKVSAKTRMGKLSGMVADEARLDDLKAFLPQAVLTRLDAQQDEWTGEIRTVSIMFVNLGIKPAKLVQLGPEHPEVLELAHWALQRVQDALATYEGTLNKFLMDDKGSTLIGVFGLPPLYHEDDSQRAVFCALYLREALAERGLSASVGVTTGICFAGSVGSNMRREYSVLGDVVNTSARLMGEAKKTDGGIYIDENTVKLAPAVLTEPKGEVLLKGKSIPTKLFEPTHRPFRVFVKYYLHPSRDIKQSNEIYWPFLGSVAYLSLNLPMPQKEDVLEHIKQFTYHNKRSVLMIESKPGLGKSAMLDEIAAYVQNNKDAAPAQVICIGCNMDSNTKKLGKFMDHEYELMCGLFSAAVGCESLNPGKRAQRTECIKAHLERLSGGDLPQEAAVLNEMMYTDFAETDASKALSQEQRFSKALQIVASTLTNSGRVKCLVMLDDCEWLSQKAWDDIFALINHTELLMFVFTCRDEHITTNQIQIENPSFRANYQKVLDLENAEQIKLSPVEFDDAVAFACEQIGVKSFPWMVMEVLKKLWIDFKNPRFLVEMIRELDHEHALVLSKGELLIAGDFHGKAQFVLPPSVRRMVLSTIEKCNPTQLIIVKVASVIQMPFDQDMLLAVYPVSADRDEVISELENLKAKNHIMMEDDQMRLRNRFVQRAIYGMMLNSQRKSLHFSIGKYLRDHGDAAVLNTDIEVLTVNHFILAGKEAEAASQIEKCLTNPAASGPLRSELEVLRRNLPSYGTQGYLVKAKSIKKGGEQRRFCSIKDRAIFYYKSDSEKDLKDPKGAIPLTTHRLIAHGQQGDMWCFELQGDKKSYFLFANDQPEMDKWMRAIQVEHAMCVTLTSKSAKTPVGQKTGYLMKSKYKIEKFGSSRRYFNLSGCLLQWWENEADAKAKALGSIDLAICTFHQHGEVSGKYCYEVTSPNKSLFLWADTASELQDWIDAFTHQVSLGKGASAISIGQE